MLVSYDFFNNLRGNWLFNRNIEDFQNPSLSSKISGTAMFATFNGDKYQLHYMEQGTFVCFDGKKSNYHKDYLYVYDPVLKQIKQYFFDNRSLGSLFYVLGGDAHYCAQDCYAPKYVFPNKDKFDSFNIIYNVVGPNKDYKMFTDYYRQRDNSNE